MAEEAISSNGFVENNQVVGSNLPPLKKKRNLPGTPGKKLHHHILLFFLSLFYSFMMII
ncbi:conserved hypothetical protein [Ricinus communis]|uniref:Uncharacterized protein n=1 Tax=Ricinus communis TaxID=3988 RepID=B9RVS5_RICCO|nr:conserved hypothetical protein [Ricinus communis]